METKHSDNILETITGIDHHLYGSINFGLNENNNQNIDSEIIRIRDNSRKDSTTERNLKFLNSIKLNSKITSSSKFKLPLQEDNPLVVIYEIYILILIQYSVISSLFFLGYEKPGEKLLQFDNFVWACFIFDFLTKFFIQVKSEGKIIHEYKGIFLNYLKTWMIFDLASLLPLHFVDHPNAEYFLRLFRILKMPKLIVMIRMENLIIKFVYKFKILNQRLRKKLVIVLNYAWNLLHQILGMLFTSYALACIWSYYTRVVVEYKDEANSFQENYNLDDMENGKKLVKIWYFIYTTLMTVGYGDLSATNKYEMGFCIILVIIAPSMYAYTMSKSIDTINRLSNSGKGDDRMENTEIWIQSIEKNYGKLNPEFKHYLFIHFENYYKNDKSKLIAEKYWHYQKKESFLTYHNSFLKAIPETLRYQMLDSLFLKTFYTFKLFFGDSNDFRYYVCLHIQPRIYTRETYIIREKTIPNEIFFITKGKVAVVIGIETDEDLKPLCMYSRKTFVGGFYVIYNKPCLTNYVVKTFAQGFALPGKVLKMWESCSLVNMYLSKGFV